jgi:hypothetical protein
MILTAMKTNRRESKTVPAIFLFAPVICLLLLTGCATDNEPIHFSGDKSLPTLATNSPATVLQKNNSLALADEQKILNAVFSNLLTRHFWDDGGYTAIFLQADDGVVAALQKKFHDRQPPIKEAYRVSLLENTAPRDRDTGQPAMILSADVSDPEADGTVTAIGKWFAGGAVTGFYSYRLMRTGDDWTILDAP